MISFVMKEKDNVDLPDTYIKWLEAVKALSKIQSRGWQSKLAEKVGCSPKHISTIFSGKTMASLKVQEKISNFFGVPYYKMIQYGKDILYKLDEEYFPEYKKIINLPLEKRFDKLIEIAKQNTKCPLVTYPEELKYQYMTGQKTEKEVYEELVKCMEMVKKALIALKEKGEFEFFPRYEEVFALPRDKRFDKIVEIAKQQTGCPLTVFHDELRNQYLQGEKSEKEIYDELLKYMRAVKRAINLVDKDAV